MRLKGKVAIVTGAGRGMGEAIAMRLAEEGAKVVVADVDEKPGQEVAEKIRNIGAEAIAIKADVAKRKEAQNVVEACVNQFKSVDILVNNAGIVRYAPFIDMTEEDWDMVVDVDLKGVFNCTQFAAKHMIRQGNGKIVSISSRSYLGGVINQASYVAAKAGVVAFTRAVARELGEYNVNVNCIAPGPTETRMLAQLSGNERKEKIKLVPLGRFGDPADIANAVLFLVSEDADFITGEVLHVTGGAYG